MADLENLKSEETIQWNIDFTNTIEELDKLEWDDPELEKAKKIIDEWWNTNEITKLTPELVDELLLKGDFWRHLELNWLKTIDVWVAEKLAWFWWESLGLSWLTSIDEFVAEKLAQFQGNEIDLWWLEEIDENTALALLPIKEKLWIQPKLMEKIEEELIKKEKIEKDILDTIMDSLQEHEDIITLTIDNEHTLRGTVRDFITYKYPDKSFNINQICNSIMENNGIENDKTIPDGAELTVSISRDIMPYIK